MKVALIPCAASEWRDTGRLLGRVELSLSFEGERECERWRESLSGVGVTRVLHARDELSTETASRIATGLGAKSRCCADLAELDLGLWTGLTEDQLEQRYASAHHELCEAPLNVCPPNGEAVGEAVKRLHAGLRKLLQKRNGDTLALVLRPFALAIARCALERRDLAELCALVRDGGEPVVLDLAPGPQPASEAGPAR